MEKGEILMFLFMSVVRDGLTISLRQQHHHHNHHHHNHYYPFQNLWPHKPPNDNFSKTKLVGYCLLLGKAQFAQNLVAT